MRNGKPQQQGHPEVLKTTAPNYATDEHFMCVGTGFGSNGSTRSAPKQARQHLQNNNSSILSCEIGERKSIGGRQPTPQTTDTTQQTTQHTPHPGSGGLWWDKGGPERLREAQGCSWWRRVAQGAQVGSGELSVPRWAQREPRLAKPMRNRTEANTAKQNQQRQAPKRRNSD